MVLPKTVLLALLPFFIHGNAQSSGTGTTTRYWDCCKASCAWKGKITLASGSNPVTSCDAQDRPTSNYDAASACNKGATYMCSNQSPWAVSDSLSYGYAATTIAGGKESSWCCACYELTFTSGAVKGKKMVVQATNTGGDLSSNQFDLAVSQFPSLNCPANESRFRAVASGSSMGVPQNGEHLRLAGDNNTAGSHLVPSAMPSQLP
jgi:hypothetical protein